MNKSEQLAQQVAQDYAKVSGQKEAALDPATIAGFASLVLEIFSMFKSCKASPAQAVKASKSPNLPQRVALRRTVRSELGRKDFRAEGDKVIEALLNSGNNLTEKDVEALYNEVDT